MMLREHAHSESVVDEAITIIQLQLSAQSLDKGRLTGTVRSDQRDSRIQINVDVDLVEDGLSLIVTDVSLIKSHEWWRDLFGIREHKHDGGIRNNISNQVDPLDSLDSRLDKCSSLGVVSELVNELLNTSNLVVLVSFGSFLVPQLFVLGLLELFEVTLVVGQLRLLEVDDLLNSCVQEVTRMGNDDDAAVQLLNVVFEPNKCGQIQVICGFVEHENFRLAENDFRDGDSHSPATGERVRRPVNFIIRETDTFENSHSFSLSGVGFDDLHAL